MIDEMLASFVRSDDGFVAEAACRGLPTEWWFPTMGMNVVRTPTLRKAKEICDSCQVKKLCYEYGVASGSWGVWGGVTLSDGRDNSRQGDRTKRDS